MKQIRQFLSLVIIPLILLFSNSCAVNPVTGEREFMLMSREKERALGEQSDAGIMSTYGLYEDPELQRFIKTKGEEMVNVSHRQGLDYEFKILDSPVINAFAAPGGYVYFTRGILAAFNNEAEFAGVLGHEIGHVAARHSAKQYSKSTLAQVGLVAGALASETFRQYAGLAESGISILFLKFSRDHERESDKLGVEYSTKIGYDAHQMANFFHTLSRSSEQSGGSGLPTFLSTHPNPDNRFEDVGKLADKWQKKENTANLKINRDAYLRMIDGLVYGDDPRQGYFEGNRFYHPELRFQFAVPSGWQTQNAPQQVQMAPEDGSALMIFTLAQGDNLKAAAENFLSANQMDLEGSESTSVNGLQALRVMARQEQQNGTLQLIAYFIQDGRTIYNFLGLTDAQSFSNYGNTFTTSIESFSKLTDQSKLNKQPARIKIVEVQSGEQLQRILQKEGVESSRLEELAILNGMQLSDRVEAGTLIKTIK